MIKIWPKVFLPLLLLLPILGASAGLLLVGSPPTPPSQTITSVTLSNTSFISGSPDGTVVGGVNVGINPGPSFTGHVGITSTKFRLSSATLPSNVVLNGTQTSGETITLTALDGASNTPFNSNPIAITSVGPGARLTTFTFANYTGGTLPAGTPVTFGQAFRYGDVMPGTQPVIRDANTHSPLAQQQWSEIDTFTENGGNGGWRHAVWSINLPASLANNGTYTVEFVIASGTYTPTPVLSLSALCTGPAAHDLKIHLTDIRNQDDTTRRTGDATFDICANIANSGRDAPRVITNDRLFMEVMVSGLFQYTDTSFDPLLYATCPIYLWVDPNTGNTLRDVQWLCHVMSPWMNVAAGTSGNAGAPGPAGLANDPQIISYRATILDGSTDVLDYSGYDATLSSASNPAISCPAGDTYGGPNCLNIPSSTGNNTWYWPQTVRVTSCTGTCVGGLTQGQLAWVYPSGIAAARTWPTSNSTIVNLLATPQLSGASSGTSVLTSSQGTGTTALQHRFWHTKWATWQTLDTSGDENWAMPGSTTRTTRRLYPQLTNAEANYWEQTGLVPPLDLTQSPVSPVQFATTASPALYTPLGRMNVIGGTGTSHRADIGIISDYAGVAFTTQTQSDWFLARLFSYGAQAHGYMAVLNEATGYIPAINNGPLGPNGQGIGTAYPQLGAPMPNVAIFPHMQGLASPLQGVPNNTYDWAGGMWGSLGTYVSHTPAFTSLTYIIWGGRHFLDMARWNANHDIMMTYTYADEPQNLFYSVRDTQLPLGPGMGRAYYCNALLAAQNRGSAWMLRDTIPPASVGGDGEIERVYFNDCMTEMANSWPDILTFMDGSAPGATEHAALPANFGGSGGTQTGIDVFVGDYMFTATYQLQTFLHSRLATLWLPTHARWYQVLLGGGTVPNSLDPYYGVDYTSSPAVHNGDCVFAGAVTGGNIGTCFNSTDGSDMGAFAIYTAYTAGSGVLQQNGSPFYTLTAGDLVKAIGPAFYGNPSETVDQLPGNQWFKVLAPNNTAGTFSIENPSTPGVAFPQFTRSGSPFNEALGAMIYRPTFVPAPSVQGFANSNYCFYARQELEGLTVLGYNVATPMANFIARAGGNIANCTSAEPLMWNPNVVVPGSP